MKTNIEMIPYEQAKQHSEYSRIPSSVLAAVYGFVEHRQPTGDFLHCVLSNDLFGAVGKSDTESYAALRELVIFIHMEVPEACHGSRTKVRDWLFPQPANR